MSNTSFVLVRHCCGWCIPSIGRCPSCVNEVGRVRVLKDTTRVFDSSSEFVVNACSVCGGPFVPLATPSTLPDLDGISNEAFVPLATPAENVEEVEINERVEEAKEVILIDGIKCYNSPPPVPLL